MKRRMLRAGFLGAVAALACLSLSARAETVTRTLSSGATLIVDHDTTATQAVIEAFFRVGVADENAVGESGLSSLLAHTWTAAGENRTQGQLARDIGRFGTLGVWSTGEYIELWTISPTSDITMAAQTLLMNLVAAPAFPDAAVNGGKRATDRERLERQDGLLTDAYAALRRRVFVLSPAGRDPLGDPESVRNATAQSLRRFYLHTVGIDASRAVFVVAGNIVPDDAERIVVSALAAGNWPALNAPKPRTTVPIGGAIDTIPADLRTYDVARPAPARTALIGFIAPGTAAGPKSWAAMQLLDTILAGGKDCRLFKLRDHPAGSAPPVGYDIRSRLEPGRDQSLWSAYVTGTAIDKNAVRDAVLTETRALADGSRPITDDELQRARLLLKGRHLRERQRLSDRASALGWAELAGLGAKFESDYDGLLDAVTADSVNTLAKRIFSANAATVVTGTEPR